MDGVAAPPTAPQLQQHPKINLSEKAQWVKGRPPGPKVKGSYRTPQLRDARLRCGGIGEGYLPLPKAETPGIPETEDSLFERRYL